MPSHCLTDDALNAALIAAQIADEEKEGQTKLSPDLLRQLKDAAEQAKSYESCPAQTEKLQEIASRINEMSENTKPMDALKVALELVKAYSDVGISLCQSAADSSPQTSSISTCSKRTQKVPTRID